MRSGHLLLALLSRPGRSEVVGHTDELEKVDVEALRRDLPQIVAGSPEAARLEPASSPSGTARVVRRGVDAAAEEPEGTGLCSEGSDVADCYDPWA